MQTIAIVNQKGGVGKSTTAVNLGAGLVRQGKWVLLIDADSQANLTEMLGWQQPDVLSPTLATVLERIISDQPIEPQDGILHHKEGMDLLPANIELSGLEVSLVNTMSRETVLRTYLNEVKRQYDYILVDCSPSLGMLTLNALTAADRVIIPVQSHYLPVKGLEQLLRTVSKVQRQLNAGSSRMSFPQRWRPCWSASSQTSPSSRRTVSCITKKEWTSCRRILSCPVWRSLW